MKISSVFLMIFSLTMVLSGSSQAQSKVKEVIVVFKTHFDFGYTDWADNVVYNYSHSTITGALDMIEKSKQFPKSQQFKWTISGWPLKQMIAMSEPSVKPRIQQAICDGNLIVQAMPLSFETEALDLEPLVRSLSYSSKINKDAGLSLPIDAKQTDVPSHSWILPTVLNNAGIKFLHIGCNAASMSPEVPLLFWWEGPDKSRVMTMYYGHYYGTSPAPPKDWKFNTWLAIVMTNDNTGVPTFDEYKDALNEIKKLNPEATVRTGSMGDFYTSLIKEKPELPVVRGDMPDTWIHGYMSMPREVKAGRILSKSVANLEALNTLTGIWGSQVEKRISPIVDDAMEQIHLWDEHSFGMAMSHGFAGYWAYGDEFENLRAKGYYEPIEYSWKEKSNHITYAANLIDPALSREIRGLAASVNISGERIVVYNPLPWERSELVTVQTAEKLKFPQVTYAEEILDIEKETVTIKRRLEMGVEVVKSTLPVAITVHGSAASCRPRLAKLLMKYKHARTVTELQEEAKDYTDLYNHRPYLQIDEWTVADLNATVEMLGLSGSPTKVKKIENVVLAHKESKRITSDEKEVEWLMQELISSHVIG